MNAVDGFAQHAGHGEHAQFVADGLQAIVNWNGVGHGDAGYFRRGQALDGLTNHDRMRARQVNAGGAAFARNLGGFDHGARGGDHVVKHNHGATLDFANDVLDFDFAAALAALLNNGQVNSKMLRKHVCGASWN